MLLLFFYIICYVTFVIVYFSFNLRHFTFKELKYIVLFLHDRELFIPWPQISFSHSAVSIPYFSPCRNHAIHAQQLYAVIINEIEDSGVFLLICNNKCTFIGQNRSTVHILHPVLRMFRAIRSLVSFQ